jgi:hypothetical protein
VVVVVVAVEKVEHDVEQLVEQEKVEHENVEQENVEQENVEQLADVPHEPPQL